MKRQGGLCAKALGQPDWHSFPVTFEHPHRKDARQAGRQTDTYTRREHT